jgi:hypothetical protein
MKKILIYTASILVWFIGAAAHSIRIDKVSLEWAIVLIVLSQIILVPALFYWVSVFEKLTTADNQNNHP